MILLDTHALIWLDEGNPRLGKKALEQIDTALKESCLYVSTISYWEVVMLHRKQHIEMDIPVDIWRKNLLSNGLQEIQLSGTSLFNQRYWKISIAIQPIGLLRQPRWPPM